LFCIFTLLSKQNLIRLEFCLHSIAEPQNLYAVPVLQLLRLTHCTVCDLIWCIFVLNELYFKLCTVICQHLLILMFNTRSQSHQRWSRIAFRLQVHNNYVAPCGLGSATLLFCILSLSTVYRYVEKNIRTGGAGAALWYTIDVNEALLWKRNKAEKWFVTKCFYNVFNINLQNVRNLSKI
jgi:hypothetical protein